jgi:hypothetical protein
MAATTPGPGVLGLGSDDFRIIGRAVAEFAARASTGPLDESDREQAAGLHDTLASWGFVPHTPVHPDSPGCDTGSTRTPAPGSCPPAPQATMS